MHGDLSLEALGAFGIRPADEGLHPVDPDIATWNESIFYDWFDAEGCVAGHVRVGRLPNQDRCWFWLFLYQDGEWLAVEEPRLPLAAMSGDGFAYDGFGLRFVREVIDPLRTSRFRASGFGRIVQGSRAGTIVPFSFELEARSIGPAHSVGDRDIDGHTSAEFESTRFEQPIRAICTQRIGDVERSIDGRGERDHSWGPRYWNMEWFFLVVSGEVRRFQGVHVRFDEDSSLSVGYLSESTTCHLEDVRFDLRYDDSLANPWSGRVTVRAEDGREISGRLEAVATAEIDASHVFLPPQPSVYRRGLIRFHPDDGGAPALGWLEINRFPRGIVHEDA